MSAVDSWGSETEPFQYQGRPPVTYQADDETLVGYTQGHLGFHGYMRAVNSYLLRRAGLGVFDLPDRCWREAFDDEVLPREAAMEAPAEEGFPIRE